MSARTHLLGKPDLFLGSRCQVLKYGGHANRARDVGCCRGDECALGPVRRSDHVAIVSEPALGRQHVVNWIITY